MKITKVAAALVVGLLALTACSGGAGTTEETCARLKEQAARYFVVVRELNATIDAGSTLTDVQRKKLTDTRAAVVTALILTAADGEGEIAQVASRYSKALASGSRDALLGATIDIQRICGFTPGD